MNEELAVLEFQIQRAIESKVYSDGYLSYLIDKKQKLLDEEEPLKKSKRKKEKGKDRRKPR